MKRAYALVGAVALIAVAIASPALGGPSLKKLTKQLRVVKKDVRVVKKDVRRLKTGKLDSVEVRSVRSPVVNNGQNTGVVTAHCRAGERATGGSAATTSGSNTVIEFVSSGDGAPLESGVPTAWTAVGFAFADNTQIVVQVICVS